MKMKKSLSVTILAMALFVAAGAAAKAKETSNVMLPYDSTLAGSHLKSGNYNILWETHSPEATVKFMHGSKVVATAEGKVVDRGKRYASNAVVYSQTSDGAKVIDEIRFGGSSEVIVFNQ